ncbi:MAG: oxygen-independent coproporphyrinogen III oxidase-like protein [Gammaproteobacteria bacterium]|nr:MAG: oxygen-independent coproporphyrinogen III oxidase-like protein [Gammaproteobacteria bacterium]
MPFNFTTIPPLSLYIHIPWCVRKCPYCDFNSHAVRGEIPEQEYVSALVADLEQDLPLVWGRTVESVFIGGGTPSLCSPDAIERLLGDIRARLPLRPAAEITLEANPGTVDRERFAGFRKAGVNRLSLGIQSFDPILLERIGRIHDGQQAHAAIDAARSAGFDNLNLDLMFGLPGQTREQALADLGTAAGQEPAHISWYELTIEPNTWFYRHPPQRPDDEQLWEMQQQGNELLHAAGYRRYEVSAWARPGRQCRHNRNYWEFGDYLGIGAGAHGKLTDAVAQSITRRSKIRHPQRYLEQVRDGQRLANTATLSSEDAVLEFAMNALRRDDGFTVTAFSTATGLPWSTIEPAVTAAIETGLLVIDDSRIHTTPRGQRYLDELLQAWVPESVDNARTG